MWPWTSVGDVWKAPHSHDVYLVVKIEHDVVLTVVLTNATQELRNFHYMNGPVPRSWTRVVAGEET